MSASSAQEPLRQNRAAGRIAQERHARIGRIRSQEGGASLPVVSVSYSSLAAQCGLKSYSIPPPTNQPLLSSGPVPNCAREVQSSVATPKISQTLIFGPLGRCNTPAAPPRSVRRRPPQVQPKLQTPTASLLERLRAQRFSYSLNDCFKGLSTRRAPRCHFCRGAAAPSHRYCRYHLRMVHGQGSGLLILCYPRRHGFSTCPPSTNRAFQNGMSSSPSIGRLGCLPRFARPIERNRRRALS